MMIRVGLISILVLVGSMANAQSCPLNNKLEGIYEAKCSGTLISTEGKIYELDKQTIEIMQSSADPCKLLMGIVLASEDLMPYFKVGEFMRYTEWKSLNFAEYNSATETLSTTQLREGSPQGWLQVSALRFKNGTPDFYSTKSRGPDKGYLEYSCQIGKWLSDPFNH